MAEREIERARKLQVSIVTCQDPTYPGNLLNIYDYPPLLYVKGSLKPEEVCVAVVGSRLASVYGRYTTERISRELALQGITIVSGLARGIDAAAHRGALAGKGRTIAVLGCGLDIIYPPENEGLAGTGASQGALVTEFPFGTPPNAPNFPSRNRIISGISLGVVVVEAGEKSGSLITARIAAEQGRSVFAVPGEIGAAGSRGTHRLIKQGAMLIENVDDILEEILPQAAMSPSASNRLLPPSQPEAATPAPVEKDVLPAKNIPGLGDTEQKLLTLIPARPVDVDLLITSSGLTAQEVLNALLILELRGLIRQMPGKQFLLKE
jgi:DNA processing protein